MGRAPSSPGSSVRPLALTMGDPAGIGLDITLSAYPAARDGRWAPFVVLADPDALAERTRRLKLNVPLQVVDHPTAAVAAFARALPVLPVSLAAQAVPGKPDAANAPATIRAIEQAVELYFAGAVSGLVTNPIAKSVLYAAGFSHPGHTEYLGALARRHDPSWLGEPLMMLAAEELKVVPLTVHVPLASVPAAITTERVIATARAIHTALQLDFGIASPRIAVAGLNPHAGEDGSIGREDKDVIAPAVAALRGDGLAVTGPHSADTLFHAAARASYDAVLAMYHDQALIPLKTLAFDRGVNITLRLPFVRTSPDHGTAFDIAGSGRASPASLIAALRVAGEIAARREARAAA